MEEESRLHIVGSTMFDIFDNMDGFEMSPEEFKRDFKYITDCLKEHGVDYNLLRRSLTPTSSIYSFIFNSDLVKNEINHITPYLTKMAESLGKDSICVFLTGDMILKKENFHVYKSIFESNNFDEKYIKTNNIFIIDVINITRNYYNELVKILQNEEAFLFSIDITKPSIEKIAMTYLLPQKCIKYKNKLIYQVPEPDDKSNYSLINNEKKKFHLVPVFDYYYYTFLTANPYQVAAPRTELIHSIKVFFNINIEKYPSVHIDDNKYKYVIEHANVSVDKKVLCKMCLDAIKRNQIYNMAVNKYSEDPELIFNVPLFIDGKQIICSIGWNFNNNFSRIITMYPQKD